MERQPYVPVDEEAQPTEESITAAQEAGSAEVRPCAVCGENVTVGERVGRLTEDGEVWEHPFHA